MATKEGLTRRSLFIGSVVGVAAMGEPLSPEAPLGVKAVENNLQKLGAPLLDVGKRLRSDPEAIITKPEPRVTWANLPSRNMTVVLATDQLLPNFRGNNSEEKKQEKPLHVMEIFKLAEVGRNTQLTFSQVLYDPYNMDKIISIRVGTAHYDGTYNSYADLKSKGRQKQYEWSWLELDAFTQSKGELVKAKSTNPSEGPTEVKGFLTMPTDKSPLTLGELNNFKQRVSNTNKILSSTQH